MAAAWYPESRVTGEDLPGAVGTQQLSLTSLKVATRHRIDLGQGFSSLKIT